MRETVLRVCEVLKDKDGAFTQAFEKTKLVGDLMEAIKKAQGFTCCTNKLKLWFATTTNDEGKTIWLPDDGDAADQLDEGEIHPHIRTLIHKAPLKLSRTIVQLMEEMNLEDPLSGQIHVLVEIPEDKKRKRDAASDAGVTQEANRKCLLNF
nr:Crinkler effector protein 115 [Phytophthora ramorum]